MQTGIELTSILCHNVDLTPILWTTFKASIFITQLTPNLFFLQIQPGSNIPMSCVA
jgi:hypothetical protein